MIKRYKHLLTLFLILVSLSIQAQDAHYWSSTFSPAGFITPGAVITNNLDSGVYYLNPAIMAWSNKTATSISGNVYSYDRFKIKNGVANGKNLTFTSTKIIPQLISKTFKLNKENPFTIGIALIQNPMQDTRSSQRMDKKINVLDDSYSPGAETYVGQFDVNSKITETYAQLSVGKRMSPRLALGATLEGSFREQIVGSNLSSKAIYNTPSTSPETLFPRTASNDTYYQTSYNHIGARLKLGASYDYEVHHFGLVLTTPMLRLYGRGSVLSDFSINNIRLPGSEIDLNLLASTRQTKIRTNWKTPVSLAAAYAYDYGLGQVSLTAEFFTGIKNYSVLKPDASLFIKNAETVDPNVKMDYDLNLNDERKSILNVGLAFSRSVNESITLMMAARTDFNYLKTRDSEQGHLNLWDNYHAQFGGNFKRRKLNLRAGVQVSYGSSSNYTQPANFDTPTELNLLVGEPRVVSAKHFAAALILSYIHNF